MKRSTTRILTTHTGSLPRADTLLGLLEARERGEPSSPDTFEAAARSAVNDVVGRQIEIGLDIINDGEQSKPSYATYIIDRLSGFDGERRKRFPRRLDSADFPAWARRAAPRGLATLRVPTCTGPIEWKRFDLVEADIAALKAGLQAALPAGPEARPGATPPEAFMSAASPGVIANMLPNEHYSNVRDYLEALARAMRREYEAIVAAGFLLQIDCPDLAMSRHSEFSDLSLAEFQARAALHVDVLNEATAGIDPERMRMHVCWGNYEGPHNHDVPLLEMAPILLRARPAALCIEGSNPRHGHEWKVWERVPLPDDKLIVTGCLDTTTNFVEHPEVVADRIVRYAKTIGRERVIAGSDCGFGSMIGMDGVEAEVAWAKLRALVEGAQIASRLLW